MIITQSDVVGLQRYMHPKLLLQASITLPGEPTYWRHGSDVLRFLRRKCVVRSLSRFGLKLPTVVSSGYRVRSLLRVSQEEHCASCVRMLVAVHHVSRSAQQATRTTYFLDEPCLFAAAGDFDVVDVRFGRFGTLRGKINRKQYSSGWGRLFSVY